MKTKNIFLGFLKILVFTVGVFLLLSLLRQGEVSCVYANKYATSDVIYSDKTTAHFEDKNFGRLDKGDVATIHIKLPKEKIFDNSVLRFYDYNVVTEVWFQGALLEAYGEDLSEKNMMIGNKYFQLTIPDEAWGSEISIKLLATADNAISNFTNLRIYPSEYAYRYFIEADPFGFIGSIVLFGFAILGICACLLAGVRGKVLANALCLISTMLLIALWLVSNEGIYTLFGSDSYFWQPLEYFAGYTIALPLILFYRGMTQKGTFWNKLFGIFAVIAAALSAGATFLNFTNLLHYNSMMSVLGAFLLITGVLLFIFVMKMDGKGKKSVFMLKTGMVFFLAACFYEVFLRTLFNQMMLSSLFNYCPLIALGALIFIFCDACAFFADLNLLQNDIFKVKMRADMLDEIISETPAGICRLKLDNDLTIVSANDIFYHLIGCSSEEVAGEKQQSILKYLHDDNKALAGKIKDEILHSDKKKGEFEMPLIDIEKKPITVMIKYYCNRKGKGSITLNAVDITARKQVEDELRMSEERYKLVLQQSGKIFFPFDIHKGTIIIPDELAQHFKCPNEISDMPERFISTGLLEPESVEEFKLFFEKILRGEKSGDAFISWHKKDSPEETLWYRIFFSSIFGPENEPISAIITYEDLTQQHKAQLEANWRQANIINMPINVYLVTEYDLTKGVMLSQSGNLFAATPAFIKNYDDVNQHIIQNFIFEDDKERYKAFSDRKRLISMLEDDITEDRIEYRSAQNGSEYRWTVTTVQLIKDPFNNHSLGQFFFQDIQNEKSGQIDFKRNLEDLKKELEDSAIKIMINQMQPHFMYNALSAIRTITKRDPQYAYDLLYDFTTYLRGSIKALSNNDLIPFRDELKNVKAYLNIENMRFGDSIKVVYDIECDDFPVLPLTLQPIAENAARHGIYPKGEEGGTITIASRENENSYIIVVEDDGVGFDVDEGLNSKNDTIGLKNLIFRLNSIMDANVEITSKKDSGTKVAVTIPKTNAGGK